MSSIFDHPALRRVDYPVPRVDHPAFVDLISRVDHAAFHEPPPLFDAFHEVINEALRNAQAVIEEACMRALASGKYGVLVEQKWEDDYLFTTTRTLTEDVPFGCIHHAPMGT